MVDFVGAAIAAMGLRSTPIAAIAAPTRNCGIVDRDHYELSDLNKIAREELEDE